MSSWKKKKDSFKINLFSLCLDNYCFHCLLWTNVSLAAGPTLYTCMSARKPPGRQQKSERSRFFSFNRSAFLRCSDESYVIGFVVPNQKHFLALAERYGVRGSRKELCNSKTMEELVLKAMAETPPAGASITSESCGVTRAGTAANVRLVLLSPARAFRDPSQDPPESGPLDPRDGVSD